MTRPLRPGFSFLVLRPALRPVLLVALLGSAGALATPNFPGAVKQHLSAKVEPGCALCHTGGVGALGTVGTPFGLAMRARGLVPNDEAALTAALDKLRADAVDGDGDGTSDIDEVIAGADPNSAGSGGDAIGPPRYGCGAQSAVGPMSLGALLLAAWALGRKQSPSLRWQSPPTAPSSEPTSSLDRR